MIVQRCQIIVPLSLPSRWCFLKVLKIARYRYFWFEDCNKMYVNNRQHTKMMVISITANYSANILKRIRLAGISFLFAFIRTNKRQTNRDGMWAVGCYYTLKYHHCMTAVAKVQNRLLVRWSSQLGATNAFLVPEFPIWKYIQSGSFRLNWKPAMKSAISLAHHPTSHQPPR